MGYQVNFMDNQLVTNEQINGIAEIFSGATYFVNNATYGVDDLNQITETLATKGVCHGCQVTVSDGIVNIGPGVLLMENGQRVSIDETGISLDLIPGVLNYVWFWCNRETGFVVPKCTETAPEDSFVLLCRITASGVVSGHPEISRVKIGTTGLNMRESYTVAAPRYPQEEEMLLQEIPLSYSGYRHIIVYQEDFSQESVDTLSFGKNVSCSWIDIESGHSFSVLADQHKTIGGEKAVLLYSSENSTVLVENQPYDGKIYKVFFRFALGGDNVLRIYTSAEAYMSYSVASPGQTHVKLILC